MWIRETKLKYTQSYIPVEVYDTGLELWPDIDAYYSGVSIRNRVICRIDLGQYLTDLFSKETIDVWRNAIINIATYRINEIDKISAILIELAKNDNKFADQLQSMLITCDENVSYGEFILQTIANTMLAQVDRYRTFFRGKNEFVICESYGYLYFSTSDDSHVLSLPDNVKVEVISYAKNWSGAIEVAR